MKNTLLALSTLSLALGASAQTMRLHLNLPDPHALHQEVEVEMQRAMAEVQRVQHVLAEGSGPMHLDRGREPVVKGAPYCADAVHETVQPLADGNRIVKRQTTRLCRDGEGRTRREVQREGGNKLVYLHDPVSRESWVLDPERKSARPAGWAAWGQAMGHEWGQDWQVWARDLSQRLREHLRPPADPPKPPAPPLPPGKDGKAAKTPPPPAADGEPQVVIENEVVIRHGDGEPQRQRDVRVYRFSDLPKHLPPLPPAPAMAPMPPMPPMPPLPGAFDGPMGWRQFMPRGEGVQTALPAKEVDGVKLNGERTTWTIEAGKIGNEKPILISREVWTSPELMLTVSSRDHDPRSGEVSYRLEKLKRGEPEASLMKVPADYEKPSPRAPRMPRAPSAPASGTKT